MFAVLAIVLYTVCGGNAPLSLPIARRAGGPPAGRKYRPLSERQDAESDDDDEVEDSVARRRVMELSSIGKSADSRGDSQASEATELASRGASSQARGSFPLTSFSRNPESSSDRRGTGAPSAEEETADQLQRELELFAQEDDDEDASLIQPAPAGQRHGAGQAGQQPQSEFSNDREIQEYADFFDQQ